MDVTDRGGLDAAWKRSRSPGSCKGRFSSEEVTKADVDSVQELVLSSIYVYQARRLLKDSFNPKSRSILYQLLVVNAVVILLDLSLLILQLVNLHELQVSLKPAIYSIKLKLEFTVLGQLICLVRGGGSDQSRKSSTFIPFVLDKSDKSQALSNDISDFVDMEKSPADLRRPSGTTTAHVSMSDTDLIVPPRVGNTLSRAGHTQGRDLMAVTP